MFVTKVFESKRTFEATQRPLPMQQTLFVKRHRICQKEVYLVFVDWFAGFNIQPGLKMGLSAGCLVAVGFRLC